MIRRKIFGAVLIIMALIVMLLPASEADAETSASDFSIENVDELVKYKGNETTVTVPNTVAVIGESAFENNKTVEKIILPNSVKEIKPYAFWGCDNLKTVTLGKGITTIGDFSFMNCDGLETITIPSNVRSIGIQAFADCDRFEDITIPPEVTDIKDDAFDRDYLLNIHCETGSYADKYAQSFYERQKNMTVYDKTEPDESGNGKQPAVPSDGVYSGDSVQAQLGIEFPNDIIGDLLGSTRVVSNQAVVMMQNAGHPVQGSGSGDSDSAKEPELPWRISERTYYRDKDMTSDTLNDNITEIGRFAYARSGLTDIVLPEGLEKIEYAAFYHCDNLTHVDIPDSVTTVESKAFAHTPWVKNFLNGSDDTEGDFLISGATLIAYRGNSEEVTIPDGVRTIAGEVFEGHSEIKRISVPVSVEYVDDNAFSGCNLEDIEYGGESLSGLFEDLLIEEQIKINSNSSINSMSSAPQVLGKQFRWTWIITALLFAGGCLCMVRKAR